MSLYILAIGKTPAEVLERAAAARLAQFAGYCANLGFWISECEHLRSIVDTYDTRFFAIREAFQRHLEAGGTSGSPDDCGVPFQKVMMTSTKGERQRVCNRAISALRRVLDRALNLGLIGISEYDGFNDRLPGMISNPQASVMQRSAS